MEHIRNVGVFANVDAGKTTLSEQLLRHAGVIRKAGSVDSGTAHTDDLPVERRRGLSVRAGCVRLPWKGCDIHLIDTPGHIDFSAEVERSLWALDAAILVICAVEGVQPQTEALFEALKARKMPTLIFINKVDRENADIERTMRQIARRLTPDAALLKDSDAMRELVCAHDDTLLERYLSGEAIEYESRMRELSRAGTIYPVLCGSALRDTDIEPVLDAVVELLPPPVSMGDALSAVVFAAAPSDRVMGRGVWMRLFGGKLEPRDALNVVTGIDPLTGEPKQTQRKVTQAGTLTAGEIGIVYGLGDIPIGYTFGELPYPITPGSLREPLITLKVAPRDPKELPALRAACETLSGEDPLLRARFSAQTQEIDLQIMGMIQKEILEEMLDTRFGLKVTFSDPTVIYRETIAQAAQGFVAYTMPKPCWAVMEFLVEPAPRGSGVCFESVVPVREIPMRYQHQAEQAIPLALSQGRLGWQVTDVKVTLIGGNSHQWHTHPLDFIVATPMGIQDALQRGGSTLLEPMLDVTFRLPSDCVGRVMSDVALMRGEVVHTEADEERVTLYADLPVKDSMLYSQTLAAITNGRGSMSIKLKGYRECPLELGDTAPRRHVDPLDTSKYILAARSALESGIFDL